MRKSLCSLGLAGLLLGGCTPTDPAATPSPAATTSRADLLPRDVASVDLTEPAMRDTIDAGKAQARRQASTLPDEVSMNLARTGLSLESQVAGRALQGHQAEIELADLAQSRSENYQVRDLAAMIESDHRLAQEKLRQATLTALPARAELPSQEKQLKQELVKLDGTTFDRAYIDGMVKGHEKTLEIYREQSRKAPTEALRAYFRETEPTIAEHLRHCKSVQASL